ncbi:MAG: hypothetical protein WBA67_06290 [Jannaschia sp.]
MAALTAPRTTSELIGQTMTGPMAAAVSIFAGAMIMRNAAGNLVPATAAANLVGVGCASRTIDNSDGAAGAEAAEYVPGIFRFANSAAADAITAADIGKLVYAVDDQTVAKTSGGASRSPAGFVEMIDPQGVWVRFDEVLTRIASA